VAPPTDPKSAAIRVGVYIFLYSFTVTLTGALLYWLGGFFFGAAIAGLIGGVVANVLSLRIFDRRGFFDIGLEWRRSASSRNLLVGLAGGAGTAILVLATAIAVRLAVVAPAEPVSWGTQLWVTMLLLLGSAGEEIVFRGYAFQILMRTFGPYTAILPCGVLFALLHGDNPGSTWLALANTAGFGILFGYAFLRSGDLWLPIGLHAGWNLMLPLAGVNVSGFTMRLAGRTLQWNVGPTWSGGDYGPEGSILTSLALIVLALYLWKAPVRWQRAPLLEGGREG
jgi:hypothetical protein